MAKTKHSLDLGVYLTPEVHHIDETPLGQYRFVSILEAVKKRFSKSFSLEFNYQIHKTPEAESLANLAEGEKLENYESSPEIGKLVLDYAWDLDNKGHKGHKLIFTYKNGFDPNKVFSLGCSLPSKKTSLVNLYSRDDYLRYIVTLHELSHLFGAEDSKFSFPYSIMSRNENARDFWGPLTKRKMQRNIDSLFQKSN